MTNEQRKKRIETIAKLVGLGVVGFLVAPFVLITIKGLVGLIVAAAIGLFAVNVAIPWYSRALANWRIKAIKAEAMKNPVETLQNNYIKQQEKLNESAKKISTFSAKVSNFEDELELFVKRFPDQAAKFQDNLKKMQQLLGLRQKNYKRAVQELKSFELEIEKADAIWQMAQAALAMNEAAGMTEDDLLEKISKDTAIDSVTTSLNTAIADLETSLLLEESSDLPLTNTQSSTNIVTPVAKEPIGINN